jgi:predicted RNA methylase
MIDNLKKINWTGASFGYDLLMINDQERNEFFWLDDCKDKIVLDIGSGTGLLSVMAAQAGARHVYTFEVDPTNYKNAKYFIKESGFENVITIINADLLSVDKNSWNHENIDIVVTETFANDCFIENFAFLVEHVENNFNTSKHLIWVPNQIELRLTLVNHPPENEFNPGVDVPPLFLNKINDSVAIFRNHFYHAFNEINLPVSQIPKYKPKNSKLIDTFVCDSGLRNHLHNVRYNVQFDHSNLDYPYLKVDWILKNNRGEMWMNCCKSWRSIAFCVDKSLGNNFYLRFNPLTHALICTQK